MVRGFYRVIVTGGGATLVRYAAFWFYISVFGIGAGVASGVGYLYGSALIYLMSYYYAFNGNYSHSVTFALFYLMAATDFFINTGAVHALVVGLA